MQPREALRERLSKEDQVVFALLFGSRTAGDRPRPDSDWDLAVYVDESLTPRERFDLRLRLVSQLDDLGRIDVVVLNDAPPLLAHRALMGEELLLRDRSAYVRFFVRTLAASGDERYWRDLHRRERRQRAQEGRFGRP